MFETPVSPERVSLTDASPMKAKCLEFGGRAWTRHDDPASSTRASPLCALQDRGSRTVARSKWRYASSPGSRAIFTELSSRLVEWSRRIIDWSGNHGPRFGRTSASICTSDAMGRAGASMTTERMSSRSEHWWVVRAMSCVETKKGSGKAHRPPGPQWFCIRGRSFRNAVTSS
jgi:hypothetical protein